MFGAGIGPSETSSAPDHWRGLFVRPETLVYGARNGGNPKWINGWFIYVSSLENPIKVKMDDLGLSLF